MSFPLFDFLVQWKSFWLHSAQMTFLLPVGLVIMLLVQSSVCCPHVHLLGARLQGLLSSGPFLSPHFPSAPCLSPGHSCAILGGRWLLWIFLSVPPLDFPLCPHPIYLQSSSVDPAPFCSTENSASHLRRSFSSQ